MQIKTSRLIKGLLTGLLLLSCVSVYHAANDTRFTLKNGVIYDAILGLQWAPAPDREINQYQAEEYVESLNRAGARSLGLAGGGWRLPTRSELKSIYDPTKPGGADPGFKINGKWVWTSEVYTDDPSLAWLFFFPTGHEYSYYRDYSNYFTRVLAVRSRR